MSERMRRPPLQRTTPIRDWRGVFGPPPRPGDDVQSEDPQPRTGTGLEEAITRSVEIGYHVIDDYIRQGQQVARSIGDGRASTETLVRDTTDLTSRMARYASDFVGAWMQMLEMMAKKSVITGQAVTSPAEPVSRHRGEEIAGDGTRVELAVTTSRRVEARLELDGPAAGIPLRVHALRSTDPAAPRIEDVTVTRDHADTPATVHVNVPAGHPEGAYEGLIIDESRNVPIGVLRITIPPSE